MKKTLKKIMVSLLLFIILFNFIVNTNVTYAITAEEFVNSVTAIMGGIVSICLWQFRMKAIIIAFLINELITTTMAGVSKDIVFVTPYKIFFNEVPITDLNFFDFAKKDPVFQFKESVAEWYYSLRIIAAAGLLLVLIYIGIRMAIATLSEDKAKYKKMFFDWLMSIALLFLMQYIILFIIEINNVLVEVLKTVNNDLDMDDVMLDLALRGLVGVGMNSMTSTIVYCGLVFLTFAFLISYINRMLKVGFLILISPLITITYALDKIKDNKSQALDTWFKEIAYTILIQPFHCIIYLSYISVCFKLIADRSDGGFGYTSLISSDFN